ncbi:HU family DNA-binding protein [Litoreibacter sp.]|nr:HU family DNA-binding protein [Litoreibacter sp.]
MSTKPTTKGTVPASSKRSSTKATSKAGPKRSTTKAAITKPMAAAKSVPLTRPDGKPDIKVVTSEKFSDAASEINKRELVERVTAQSGMKKGDARRAVDAVLTALGSAIAEGKDIAAAPLGKIKIVRKKQTPNGELAVLRVKLKDPNKVPKPKPDPDDVAASSD